MRGLYAAGDSGIRYNGAIAIGRGFRGKEFEGLGIGNCCRGASCCVKGCPPTGRDVLEALTRRPAEDNLNRHTPGNTARSTGSQCAAHSSV